MHIAVGTYLAEKTAWSKGPEVGPCSSCFRNGSKSYQTHGTPGSRTSQSQRLEAAIGTTAPPPFQAFGSLPLPLLHSLADVDECQEYGSAICGAQRCENTPGSYRCTPACDPGYQPTPGGGCQGGCPWGSSWDVEGIQGVDMALLKWLAGAYRCG